MAMLKHLAVPAVHLRRAPYLAGAVAAVLALSACGGGDGSGGGGGGEEDPTAIPTETPSVEADPELAEMVPQELRDEGTITIGTDSSYAPSEFLAPDGSTIVGFDVQLFNAVAAKLDLQPKWESASFGTIVEGVDTGKYDVGVSSFTINEERLEQANMVSYYTVGTQWFTAAGNPDGVDPDNACGLNVAVQANTVQVEDIQARSEQCEEDGKEPITINQFEGQDQATESIISGRNDAGLADMPVAVYAVQQTGGQLETLGEQYEAAPYGAVVAKDNTELAEAIAAGYQSIMDDGTYTEILANWELDEQGTLDKAEVNPELEG
ncbi:polar amino acid transport system substrate-binding protein [Streptomonospora nanhaiensis]|uniref:Polar amino acid transport system substrate-binding protein n=2 Tax=Streptomonospora nanhaiensis TaxID=1323731 RepID=A0A853BQK2_9ACTN|nr:polar amino acid transport system substrate-binding protein [Streptomonospora nanhaiensis]